MYRLLIQPPAEKDWRKLPADLLQRIHARLLALQETPRPPGALKLAGDWEGWRLRVGDYRILYLIDDTAQTVTIARVRHRREVYR